MAIALLAGSVAYGACIGQAGGVLAAVEDQAFRDPHAALAGVAQVEQQLRAAGTLTSEQQAMLAAIAADAHRQLDHSAEALAMIEQGVSLTQATPHTPLGIRLRIAHAMMLDDNDSTDAALTELDRLIGESAQIPRAVACAQRDRGWIRDSTGDTQGSLRDLIAAFEYLSRNGPEEEAMVTAGRLATVYRRSGDFDTAAALTRETVDYFARIGAPVRVATGRYRLGKLFLALGHPDAARAEFDEMRRLSVSANDANGAALALLGHCEANVDLKVYAAARADCAQADAAFQKVATRYPMDIASLQTQLGRIALGSGDTRSAIAHFTAALDTHAKELNADLGAVIYEGLAAARASAGDFAGAYSAALEHERRMTELGTTHAARERAALRVRFDMDREVEKNRVLLREREVLIERNSQNATKTRLVVAIAFVTLLASIALLVLVNRRREADVRRRAAEARVDELGRLCAGVAHDFNNLMTVIQQAAGMLRRSFAVEVGNRPVELLDAIRAAATAGGDITRQLLAFGRQESMAPRLVECRQYFDEQRSLFEQAAGREGTIEIRIADPKITAWIDPAQLTNALVNLVINSREALDGPGRIMISVMKCEETAGFTVIEVADTGRGMTPETLERATEVFFSTKQPGQGSGLGLSAAHGFAIQSGGRIHIRSEPGVGTTVQLVLPADKMAFDASDERVRR